MKPTKSSDAVIKVLLDLIMKGEIKPGDKLPSAENIAKSTGTSVITAREAVQNLAAIGLVEIMHGRGIFLTEGAPVIEELLEARKVIESSTVVMATRNLDSAGLDAIERLLDRMDVSLAAGNTELFSELDYEFHFFLAKASGNRILLKTLENIKELLRYQQSTINRLPYIVHTSALRHREIFTALKNGNAELAGSIMDSHISEVIDAWKNSTASA
jgi:GntR family transcriptional regulator, transcriptional repressor for pyruvate dehydrogenase complex